MNRRLSDTYSAALSGGFPSEIIKAHQIPDAYGVEATAQFSEVGDRITPIDYAMTAGVGFGYTRYGVWVKNNNQQKAAHTSGFESMVAGEYQALTTDQDLATEQLKYMFANGAVGVHCMFWPPVDPKSPQYNKTMAEAVAQIAAKDEPRPGVTGGIGMIVPYHKDDRVFNIACVGAGPERTGLLKSLKADGTWEGSVYAVPFRTQIETVALQPETQKLGKGQRIRFGPLDKLDGGQQIEVTFRARSDSKAPITYSVRYGDQPLPGLSQTVQTSGDWKNDRFILRSQLPADGLFMCFDIPNGVTVEQVVALRENDVAARIHRSTDEGKRHRGGVTLDVLE